ncbi:hypothetical protein SE17_10805 [Kouleothrix aurantiaca]|jgi:transcriptional antiterminator RfaH|uniref:NusG-like N-terminal domain-containing protein n=1 Tax=Kouleothrix aurantiaca TaxID=186479 RepID=A0A0P9DII9_9CHLR|nr:hypothetical protein SE17_10805 [Kouleothrix aurantiaca]
MNWYIVQCKHSAEAHTAVTIRTVLRLEVYLPEIAQRVRGRMARSAFFPGYLFVRMDITHTAPSRVMSIPGVIRMLTFERWPEPVPDDVVALVRTRVEAWGAPSERVLQPGEGVQVVDGPFAGLNAIFLGNTRARDRVQILLEFMGQQRQVETDRAMVQPGAARRGRRTRGRKRWLRHI